MTDSRNAGPAVDVIPLSEQFENHDEYSPEATGQLAGRTLSLHIASGPVIDVAFETASSLRWSSADPIEGETGGEESYEAVELRDGILLLVVARLPAQISLLAIVDLDNERVLFNLTRLLPSGELPEAKTSYLQAGIDGALRTPFERTTELVGKRIHHRYSSTHAFEHIYLNECTYAYHGLEGPEKGVADVDLTDTFKIGDDLYLFAWHERSQPFNGAIAIDLAQARSFGRLFGWDRVLREALQIRTGSVATVVNETSYEGL